jgi:hypothetical protein
MFIRTGGKGRKYNAYALASKLAIAAVLRIKVSNLRRSGR